MSLEQALLEMLAGEGGGGLIQETRRGLRGDLHHFWGVRLPQDGLPTAVCKPLSKKSFPALFSSSGFYWVQGQWCWTV